MAGTFRDTDDSTTHKTKKLPGGTLTDFGTYAISS